MRVPERRLMPIVAGVVIATLLGCACSSRKFSSDGATDILDDRITDASSDASHDAAADGTPDPIADGIVDVETDVPTTSPGFVTIPPGSFTMGSPESEPGRSTGETEHTVTLTHPFEIMQTEVTQEQFEALMGYNPSHHVSCGGDCPVEQVTWHEAAAFANALSMSGGYPACYTCTGSGSGLTCEPGASFATPYDCPGYRLPTEAEWEYAARAGTTEATYNGTSTLMDCVSPNGVLDPIAWFCGNSSSTTHEVGALTPNDWDLFDMIGSVWEWCHDWYDTYPGTVSNPWGPATGTARSKRGGSWFDYAELNRAAARNNYVPSATYYNIGMRIARTLP